MSAQLLQHFHDERAAYDWVEARLWPTGAKCPQCGSLLRVAKLRGATTKVGLYKCYACRIEFNVKGGTIFEMSHVPLRLWLQGASLARWQCD